MSSHAQLVELLERRRVRAERQRPEVHPITGKPLGKSDLVDVFPPGVSREQLDAFAARTGIRLPSSLRGWLSITNGAAAFFGIRPVDHRCDVESVWHVRPYWMERGWIPVARDDFGNYYVQSCPRTESPLQPVFFVEAVDDDNPSYVTASDMLRFAAFYLEDEADTDHKWPFCQEHVVSRDPAILDVDDLPYPWGA